MSTSESQDIEEATATIAPGQPDQKTRRYDRQLRIWAASGQAALEASRILVLSSSATSTSILKNLVLPGIGHFSILDSTLTTPADAGNNFFLNASQSIGKPRAQEAVPLLRELNESVQGEAVIQDVKELLSTDQGKDWLRSFSIIIAHNLNNDVLAPLSTLLWANPNGPPLISVRSAGFLAEFHIQYHEHSVSQSHSENAPSLRITRPFPALLEWARSLDLQNMDPTDHSHIPMVVILVRALDEWWKSHDGSLPKTAAEKKEFKNSILAMKIKLDEENFEEAEAQAWRVWSEPAVPSDIQALFSLPPLPTSPQHNSTFHALLQSLSAFVSDPSGPGTLPISATLPDMKSDTKNYVRLQNLYRAHAEVEKTKFKEIFAAKYPEIAKTTNPDEVDSFVKNAHHIRVLRGKQWGALDRDREAIVNSLTSQPRETATHLALSALSNLLSRNAEVTIDALNAEVLATVGQDVDLPEELEAAVGEIARAPTADLPNTAAFLGGLVAQEAIKVITEQYVPLNGYCVVDLIDSWTGVIN
ncbi:hypothetical protein DICSQDRAFT_136405 [Dichomitus squalens LYAD-421 SS1]|uniref:NEDD8-activating enzyme E1 regulatory subunit n=1 Tax=Dichomitus squalens (strain LYAD-421) TaxID=732165 RepID=R7SZ65_DICSQ|nr:uncharacterized protein DICSQDRAFT_136405 [Dichomitus squalens LYAD-421 SS1]EJF61494.1 hypothetical protein DICSQDRAFT_136405 [Dichomitus squalens LYAD-421 SS1]